MSESTAERLERLRTAADQIIQHSPKNSLKELIDEHGPLFNGFRMVYATDNIETEFNSVSLSSLETECPALVRYFAGKGLLFYSDEIHRSMLESDSFKIKIDYSIGFDTQVAEAFRLYESGKNISDWNNFCNLIQYVTKHEFNFDYTFYIIEDLINAADTSNNRPFNTVRALKRFDSINVASLMKEPKNPTFFETREEAGQRACDALGSFLSSDETKLSLVRRKAMLLILMKATSLLWKSRKDVIGNLTQLISFAMERLGRFAKLEIYFAWKLLKYGDILRFFSPIRQPIESALIKINGMSWDLYSIRHQETMASYSKKGTFFVPLFATLDRRLIELRDACPIRCILIDDRDRRLNTIFVDELEFFTDVQASLTGTTKVDLLNVDAKVQRLSRQILDNDIDKLLNEVRIECEMQISK
jgi:hypothetical protein